MPIPKPKKGEGKKEFISRCMGNAIMVKEYPDQKQRSAICYSQVKQNEEEVMLLNQLLISNYDTRMESLEGRSYLVAPVVMLKEGVHNGSSGPAYYPSQEIAKSSFLWNGVPVTLPHPCNSEGQPISANDSPKTLADFKVGRVWNVSWDSKSESLKGEIWIDIEKVGALQEAKLLDLIKTQKPIDVSTGLFSDEDGKEGKWNDEAFAATLSNIRPDHLALLPGSKGACSWEDGCGIRANFSNKRGLDETMSAVYRAVEAMNNNSTHYYVLDVFKDFIIYEKGSIGTNKERELYKQAYSIDSDNVVTLNGEPSPVVREVKYVLKTNTTTKEKEESKMAKKDEKKCCPEKVQLLIENEASNFTEDDREWLEGMTEEQIDKLTPPEPTTNEEETPKANENETPEDGKPIKEIINENQSEQKEEEQTAEQYIQNAPAGIREMLGDGLAMFNKQKADLVKGILTNKSNSFTEEELTAMEMGQLRKLAALAKTNSYAGRGGTTNESTEENEVEPLELPTMNWEK